MDAQQGLFEERYAQIVGTDRVGWSDEETSQFAIDMYHRQLAAVGVHGGDLLELGCGRGNIALSFARLGWEVTGVDFSPTAIRWANELAITQNYEATFLEGDLRQAWPFESESFDVALDANCLHFFHGKDRAHFLNEAKRILRPNAYFLVSTIINQPKPEDWEVLAYDPETRTSQKNGVALNYYAESAELMEELMAAGFRVMSSVVTTKDHDLMWATLKKAT